MESLTAVASAEAARGPAPFFDVESAYLAHGAPLRRWLTSRVRDSEAADDIAQEAFVRLVREVRAGRIPDEPGAWLHRVAANLSTSRGRRIGVANRHLGRLATAHLEPGPEASAIQGEARMLLDDLLACLPATDRQAVVLAAAGHRGPEIARRIGRSAGATRTLLCRTRARLRGQLLAAGYEPG